MRKIPKFLLGFLAGIGLSILVVLFIYNCLMFPRPENVSQSPTIPFYVNEDHPRYSVYELLNSPEYWEKMSLDAQKEAEDFLKKQGREEDVDVHCVGNAQSYKVYYSYPRFVSLSNWNSKDEVETVIIDFIEARYTSDVMKISGEE